MRLSRLTLFALTMLGGLTGCDRIRTHTFTSQWRPTDQQVAKVDAALARFQNDPTFKAAARVFAPGPTHDRTYYGAMVDGERRIYVALSDKPARLRPPNTQHRPATRPRPANYCAVAVAVYKVSFDAVIEQQCLDKRFSR